MPLAYDASDACHDARALAQTVATGLRILALAETEWIQIHYNNWLPEDGKSPIDKWTAAWIETGAAGVTQGGSVRRFHQRRSATSPAQRRRPDIRDQPGGDALFQFWMEKRRRKTSGSAGTGTGRGVGGGTGWGQGLRAQPASAVSLATS